eukprot:GFUD01132300.1.p1 GENE.GFUD01132300.1~~GFUD01132300.1.p1  ORF type:complete len:116 (-),score=29.81 GFUD01132300.1:72-419(-)
MYEVGMYQKTKDSTEYNGHVRPVYKKRNDFPRFLLQVENGDWVIALDKAGEKVGLKQETNYQPFPDSKTFSWTWTGTYRLNEKARIKVTGVWPCEAQDDTKYIYKSDTMEHEKKC